MEAKSQWQPDTKLLLCSQSDTGPAPLARFCQLPCQKADLDEGRELKNSEALADVCFAAHNGL